MSVADSDADKVRRRLYSLYPEQIRKLQELSKLANISQSEYLRQLIDVAYVAKVQKETQRYTSCTP